MRLLVTRPDGARTAAELRTRGHQAVVAPLLRIEPIADVDLGGNWIALVLTSANAVRAIAAHPRYAALKNLPVFAVGERSAQAAREIGFADVTSADGDATDLAGLVVERVGEGTLLYLAGEDRAGDLAGDLAAHGLDVRMAVVYRAVPAPSLPDQARAALAAGRNRRRAALFQAQRRGLSRLRAPRPAFSIAPWGSLTIACRRKWRSRCGRPEPPGSGRRPGRTRPPCWGSSTSRDTLPPRRYFSGGDGSDDSRRRRAMAGENRPGGRRPVPTIELTAAEIAGEPERQADSASSDAAPPPTAADTPIRPAAGAARPPTRTSRPIAASRPMAVTRSALGFWRGRRRCSLFWSAPGPPHCGIRATTRSCWRHGLPRWKLQLQELAGRPAPPNVDGKVEDLAARTARVEAALARPPSADPALAGRIAAAENSAKAAADALAALNRRIEDVAGAAREARGRAEAAAGQNADQNAAAAIDHRELETLTGRTAALEQAAKTMEAELARRTASADRAARVALAAAALKAAVERGEPFAAELAAARPLAGDRLAPLEPFARDGRAERRGACARIAGTDAVAVAGRRGQTARRVPRPAATQHRASGAHSSGRRGGGRRHRRDRGAHREPRAAGRSRRRARRAAQAAGGAARARGGMDQEGGGAHAGRRAEPALRGRKHGCARQAMIRVVLFFILVGLFALGVAWLAERPGDVAITWQGWRIETSLLFAVAAIAALIVVATLLWSLIRALLRAPSSVAAYLRERRQRRGFAAISRGLVAVGAGDARAAQKFAQEAERKIPAEPLALLLNAQTAQLAGDRAAAERAFRAMARRGDTKLLGLRGLFVEARRRDDLDAARAYAEEAANTAPALAWAGQAVLEFRCAAGDWAGALAALESNRRSGLLDRADACAPARGAAHRARARAGGDRRVRGAHARARSGQARAHAGAGGRAGRPAARAGGRMAPREPHPGDRLGSDAASRPGGDLYASAVRANPRATGSRACARWWRRCRAASRARSRSRAPPSTRRNLPRRGVR